MKKADVQFHTIGYGGNGCAAINVKIHGSGRDVRRKALEAGDGDREHMPSWAEFFDEWCDENQDDPLWDAACRDGWDRAEELARETFALVPRNAGRYGVTSEGRSGGWLIVTLDDRPVFTREEVAGWDAISLGRYATFARRVRELADDVPYQYGSLVYINEYEREADNRDKAYEIGGDNPFAL